MLSFVAVLIALLNVCSVSVSGNIVIIDAGSTGSRGFLCSIDSSDKLQCKTIAKITPGLSSFADNTAGIGNYLNPLLAKIGDHVRYKDQLPLFIFGTAGLRTLHQIKQNLIWKQVENTIQSTYRIFLFSSANFGTISGHDEAFYAALATNYLTNRIDESLRLCPGCTAVGTMDLGGSSTQLIMYNSEKDHETFTHDHFWSYSWLSFGVQAVRRKVLSRLVMQQEERHSIENPCDFVGHQALVPMEFEDAVIDVATVGTGDYKRCQQLIKETIWPEHLDDTEDVHSVYRVDGIDIPAVDGKEFYAISAYYYAFDCVRHIAHGLNAVLLPTWPNPTIEELEAIIPLVSAWSWDEIIAVYTSSPHRYTNGETQLGDRLLEIQYIVTLLSYGFGFNRHKRSIHFATEVNGMEAEWTTGFALSYYHQFANNIEFEVKP